jgi:hypothetical protein
MATSTSLLKPLTVSPRLHAKTKLIATLDGKQIGQVADELYLPIAEKRADELMMAAATKPKNGKVSAK